MLNPLRAYKETLPQLGHSVFIDPSAVLVGDIKIGNDSSVWPLVAIRGDVNQVQIGERTNIQDGCVLHVTRKSEINPEGYPLCIGDDVTVGHKAVLHACHIGSRVLIGMGAIVLDNADIEDDVMIAAGSLVPPNKKLVSGFLYKGNPAKQARPLSEAEIGFLKQSADNYVALKDEYLTESA